MKKIIIILLLFSTLNTNTWFWVSNGWGGSWVFNSILALLPPASLALVYSICRTEYKKDPNGLKNAIILTCGASCALVVVNLINIFISETMLDYDGQRAQNLVDYQNALTQIKAMLQSANCTCP